jgi:hypothetical protein
MTDNGLSVNCVLLSDRKVGNPRKAPDERRGRGTCTQILSVKIRGSIKAAAKAKSLPER